MESLLKIADDLHDGLRQVKPSLTIQQHEQINDLLLSEDGFLLQALHLSVDMSESKLDDSCRQLSGRLTMDVASPASWAGFVVQALSRLLAKGEYDKVQFIYHIWHVALAAEETHDGVGKAVLRRCISSLAYGEDSPREAGLKLPGSVLLVLMDFAVTRLRSNGNPPTAADLDLDGENVVLPPSRAGFALAIEAAAVTMSMIQHEERRTRHSIQRTQAGADHRDWRWDLHAEVLRLLRDCRMEEIRKQVVVTLMQPLYGGWGNTDALEDLWTFIASASGENIELHVGILCLLFEDLIGVLALPTRSSHAFWDLIYRSISNSSDLCRRRGVHVLRQVLAWADGSDGKEHAGGAQGDTVKDERNFSGDCLLQWTDYVRVLALLEVETETHLLDQVIPTVTRLCSMMRPTTFTGQAPPSPTEFRWLGILLNAMLRGGTVPRRRHLMHLIVTRELGLGSRADDDDQALGLVHEAWMVQVFLPALDHVGWDNAKGDTNGFTQSVIAFIKCYVESLSLARFAKLLTLLFETIRERKIASTGVLSAVLAAFSLDKRQIPAMGVDLLLRLKDALRAALPPLDQVQRVLLLDGMVHILGAFTDYERVTTSLPLPSGALATTAPRDSSLPRDRVTLVLAVLSAIPENLAKDRYLSKLAGWVAGVFSRDDQLQVVDEHTLWYGIFKGSLERHLRSGVQVGAKMLGPHTESNVSSNTGGWNGRMLCTFGLIVSESFALSNDREEVLASGLTPVASILRKCWHEPYLAADTVQAALAFFSGWIAVSGDTAWRVMPLSPCMDEVVTLVTARLCAAMACENNAKNPDASEDASISGGSAQVLLGALSAASSFVTAVPFGALPGVMRLRDRCCSLLREIRLPPISHLLAIASLDIILRAQHNHSSIENAGMAEGKQFTKDSSQNILEGLSASTVEEVVLSLLLNKLEGRVSNCHGQHGSADWAQVLKEHEMRKWSCLNRMLPIALENRAALTGEVCHEVMDGLRVALRDELPMTMACFRTIFPRYLLFVGKEDRKSEFMRIFKAVWGVFREVRRPQAPLVRDLVSGVLHPVLLSMPELNGEIASPKQVHPPPLVDACNIIREFGEANKPGIIRQLIGRLTAMWRQVPGSALQFIPGIAELALFKEWRRGSTTIFSTKPSSVIEAPRLVLLLFIENHVIPAAADGDKDSRHVLRALTFYLMELQNSPEFRQCSITDAVTYGRRLRAWQALCILCGYLCHATFVADEEHISEVMRPINSWFWIVHRRTCLPPVRQFQEVFAVRMCKAYPQIFLPSAVKELSDFRLPGQVLCSLLVVAGHALIGKEGIECLGQRTSLFNACLPWMVGTHVMGRMIAQLICHTILPEVAAAGAKSLDGLFTFLRDNPDMVKMRERQLEAFNRTDCAAMCTVSGMLEAHSVGSDGDITPSHLVEILHEVMDDIWNETMSDKRGALEDGRDWHQTMAEVKTGTWFEDDPKPLHGVDSHMQRKILPWDKLELVIEEAEASSLEQTTAAGKRRQSVVMCATLVEKVPNLAGLARTCEIFAASSLVVPDRRLVKHPSFSLISTGAEQWLPIEEVGEKRLLGWLRRAKRQGYTIVGIEQMNSSVCLTKTRFPENVVFVLGREQSGLPLSIIAEMDYCCEIPQQGVLRSLNAHVSGALILWEYTRQMLALSEP